MKTPVIGLIGGIGSGKSRVAAEFARHGARVISGDLLGHEALQQKEIRERVVGQWGQEVLDAEGRVDRRKLGAIVFADAAERKNLEALVFPYVAEHLQQDIAAAVKDPAVKLVVVDAAIMLEAGWDQWCDRILFIQAPRDVRLAWLAEQRGWSAQEVAARESAQWPLEEKLRRADYVIDNSATPEEMSRQVEHLLREWKVEN